MAWWASVFDPMRNRMYTAVRGGGRLRRTELRCAVNEPVALDRALLGTGFGYSASDEPLRPPSSRGLLPQIRDIRRFGSAALNLCQVAGGRLDAYYEEGVQHWDVAAGGLIATEAGALMTPSGLTGADTGWLVAGPESARRALGCPAALRHRALGQRAVLLTA